MNGKTQGHKERNDSAERLFLQLLHPEVSVDLAQFEDKAAIAVLKSYALKHRLLPLIYVQLKKKQKAFSSHIPLMHFLKEVRPLFLNNAAISMRHESIEKEIISLLSGRDIDAVVIKGNAITKEIYHEPSCRTVGDIDILVRDSDFFHVNSILCENGYLRDPKLTSEYSFYRLHQASYKHPGTQTHIEIHWIFAPTFLHTLSSGEIWQEITVARSGKGTLSPGMTLIQLLINHHMNAFRSLKRIVDILWTLHRYEDVIDWAHFAAQLKKIGLIRATSIALHQIQSLWREQATDMESFKALHRDITGMGVKQPKRLMAYFSLNLKENYVSTIFKDKVIARFALDKKWPAILLSFLKMPFPHPQAVKGYYKDQRTWMLPWNYCCFTVFLIRKWIKSDPRKW
jgi:hypothetical protein